MVSSYERAEQASLFLTSENTIEMVKGTTKTFEVTVQDEKEVAVNITGARVIFSVKKTVTDEHPLLMKTSDNVLDIALVTPRSGKLRIYINPNDTTNLETEYDYIYDVWVILPTGDRHAVIPPSIFRLRDSVTRLTV